jgi:hypothetical protein
MSTDLARVSLRRGLSLLLALGAGLALPAQAGSEKTPSFAGSYSGFSLFSEIAPPDPNLSGRGSAFGFLKGRKFRQHGRLSLATLLSVDGTTLPLQTQIRFRDRAFTYRLLTGTEEISGSGVYHTRRQVIRYSGTASSSASSYTVSGRILWVGRQLVILETLAFDGGELQLSTYLKRLTF